MAAVTVVGGLVFVLLDSGGETTGTLGIEEVIGVPDLALGAHLGG
jgi:hypothetical protein